jgi:hypothetical protein
MGHKMPGLLYPRPGTMAERILLHIQANPGVSTNAILKALHLNPSPARVCLQNLLEKRRITCHHDDTQVGCPNRMLVKAQANRARAKLGADAEHHYTAVEREW